MPLAAPKLSVPGQPGRPSAKAPGCVRAIGAAQPATPITMSRGRLDPQLTRVIDAWPGLSRRTREALLAIIDVASGSR
jgi:hypothetical protein